uniref:PX domain-containing protein n=1 Tax=Panagrolaimus superbus TaxID=310955 RepID=A0A914YSV2_9BILA
MPDLHIALTSRENEIDYLRVVADFLVEQLVDETRVGGRAEDPDDKAAAELISTKNKVKLNRPWPSQCVRHFLRELVLSTILIPLLDFVSNPDTLNNILLGALEPNKKNNIPKVDTKEIKSKFLAKLTECSQSDTPDSLIVLKLSEVIREPRLLQLFYMYLHDIRGPAHFVDCFLQAHDLHNDIHKQKESEKMSEELHSDAWTLYSDYIHESAPHRIRFENEQIPADFHTAVDSKDANLMKKVAEEVYKEMYHRLNYQYLIPFCQSECYLGYLCGAPPDVVEFIRGPKDDEELNEHRPPTESSFSLSQFRNKLLNAFSSQISMDEEEDLVAGRNEDVEIQEGKSEAIIGTADIVLADTEKDLNKWIVTVPTVEPRKDVSGRVYFVYVIQIERLDISNSETSSINSDSVDFPSTWTITRKYDEFHILEKKLQEFYGGSIKLGILPDKKALQQKNPTFMDTQRHQFENFARFSFTAILRSLNYYMHF